MMPPPPAQTEPWEKALYTAETAHRAVRGAPSIFLSQAFKFFLLFGTQLVLAHWLTPDSFGVAAMGASVMGLFALFTDMGLLQVTIQRPGITKEEISALFWVNTATSIGLGLLLAALSPFVARFYGVPEAAPATAGLALLLPLGGLNAQALAVMNRQLRFTALATIDVVSSLSGVAAGLVAAGLGAGYWSLIIIQWVGSGVSLLLTWMYSGWRPLWPAWVVTLPTLLRFGLHLVAFNMMNYLTASLDDIAVGYRFGPASLGVFDRGFKLVTQPLNQLSAPMRQVMVPLLSRLITDESGYRILYRRALFMSLALAYPGLICICLLADEVVAALLGSAWAAVAPVLHWLALAGLFSVASGSAYWLFVSQDRVREQTRGGIYSACLTLIALGAGLPYGPVGIARCYALFAPLIYGYSLYLAAKRGPIKLLDLREVIIPVSVASFTTGYGLWMLHPYLSAIPWVAVMQGFLFSYTSSVALLFAMPASRAQLISTLETIRAT